MACPQSMYLYGFRFASAFDLRPSVLSIHAKHVTLRCQLAWNIFITRLVGTAPNIRDGSVRTWHRRDDAVM
ncbi:hypothetical protein PTKU46_97910 [Paraburkholderia terrae]